MWFIGVKVEEETSAPRPPPLKKNPGSAPVNGLKKNPASAAVSGTTIYK